MYESSGQTYDKVIVHPDCFESGQLYVALSRCRSVEGLYLDEKIKDEYLISSSDVIEFYKNIDDLEDIDKEDACPIKEKKESSLEIQFENMQIPVALIETVRKMTEEYIEGKKVG